MVRSKGIEIDSFYIPPFELDAGDIVIIQLPNGPYYSGLLFKLADILTGTEKNDNVELTGNSAQTDHLISRQTDHQKLLHNLM